MELFENHSHYRFKRRLASGGMGEIYLIESYSHSKITDGFLVIKTISKESHNRIQQIRMLKEEGRIALRLRHQNIIETFDIEYIDKDPILAMEYIPGPSFAELLGRTRKKKQLLPIPFVLTIIRDIACGLNFAHNLTDSTGRFLGLVHRDVSPANMLLSTNGIIKLIDFGVAKAKDSGIKTGTGIVKGKLSYMPPEHIQGQKPDFKSDLWSLGVVLWESLVLERLFSANSFQEIIEQVLHLPLPPPSTLRNDIPKEIDDLCMSMIERNKASRISSCLEIVNSIENFIGNSYERNEIFPYVKNAFPRKSQRWEQEALRLATLRGNDPIPTGLVESHPFDSLDEIITSSGSNLNSWQNMPTIPDNSYDISKSENDSVNSIIGNSNPSEKWDSDVWLNPKTITDHVNSKNLSTTLDQNDSPKSEAVKTTSFFEGTKTQSSVVSFAKITNPPVSLPIARKIPSNKPFWNSIVLPFGIIAMALGLFASLMVSQMDKGNHAVEKTLNWNGFTSDLIFFLGALTTIFTLSNRFLSEKRKIRNSVKTVSTLMVIIFMIFGGLSWNGFL